MDEYKDAEMYSPKWWLKQVASREKELDTKWRTGADKVVIRFLDRREDQVIGDESDVSKYNIFWANTQILKSALYASPPKPTVTRQNADAKDDPARVASLMLERILSIGLSKDESDMHEAFVVATEDRLVPGLGQVWLRYEVETEKFKAPDGTDQERITHEDVVTDYVYWRDFVWGAARTWKEVPWVARRCWMGRKAFVKRFDEARWKAVRENSAQRVPNQEELPKGFAKGKAAVWEIWCAETNRAHWVCSEFEEDFLDDRADPLELRDFFPCPRPLLGTHLSNDLVPRPDYAMAQDQYEELDTLNSRIAALTRALRVVGAYDKDNEELKRMLSGPELAMIAVENWAMLSEKGGMTKAVDWFPVDVVSKVLGELTLQRQQVIGQIYELTGVSDIMRGASNPRETLGAQKLKAQYSSVRLQLQQQDIAKFVRHAMRIKAEIVSRHMQPQTIVEQSQILSTENPPELVQAAMQLLKNSKMSQYRIEISEESLSMADYTAEREMRVEYLTAVGQFLSQAAGAMETMPQSVPYLLQMVQWVSASFRGSTQIEGVLDQAIESAKNNPPKPEQEKPDTSIQVATIKAQVDTQNNIRDNQAKLEIAKVQPSMKMLELQHAEALQGQALAAEEEKQTRDIANKVYTAALSAHTTSAEAEAQRAHEMALPKQEAELEKEVTEQENAPVLAMAEAVDGLKEVVEVLAKVAAQTRVRTPVRDPKTGDIIRVEDSVKV
ncbi:MAG: hypothetical protein ABL993_08235 [Vicinamibacterales bacterium]